MRRTYLAYTIVGEVLEPIRKEVLVPFGYAL
jgi:hypothetical protein